MRLHVWLALGTVLVSSIVASTGQPQSPPQYEEVQRILTAHCVSCHSEDLASAGLRLDSFEALMEGEVVQAGSSQTSELMVRIRGEGDLPQMPQGFAPLSAAQQKLIADWIDAGAVAPSGNATTHWAFVAPVKPDIPDAKHDLWVKNPIDAFVLDRLTKEGLSPSAQAKKTTLIRRVTLDLTGLPPTPKEIDDYLSDKSLRAYEKVVDRLLASQHYGEKMALPWLDAARYADSNGFQMEGDNYQYVWRDWVVNALNSNMPFDQFSTLQLAGDLLPGVTQQTKEGRDALIATGFNRNHMLNGEGGAIREEQRNVIVFDRVDTTSTVWLGLTMACARCHDHKYDPVSQRDYFEMMAFFNNVPESGAPEGGVPYSVASPWIYAGTDQQMAAKSDLEKRSAAAAKEAARIAALPSTKALIEEWKKLKDNKAPKDIQELLAKSERSKAENEKLDKFYLDKRFSGRDAETYREADKLRNELNSLKSKLPRPMVMSDDKPRDTHIYDRGDYTSPLEKVEPAAPSALPGMGDRKPNRLGFAEWVVDPGNPLTARVAVNRAWQVFFGEGLVRTSENFGIQSEPPSHPELLDWLAVDFVESGWDVKRLHKQIVMSSTYRQSSRVSPELFERDPENRLLARGSRFRLPAMLLRDVALASSGLINREVGGKPVYPYQPSDLWDGLNISATRDFTYPQSKGGDLYRRSIYTFWRRTVSPGNMFDASSRQVCTVRESRTSTPLHALTTMNDVTWVEAGRVLAQRVMLAETESADQLRLAFRLVCSRSPSFGELRVLLASLRKAEDHYLSRPNDALLYLEQGDSKRDDSLDPIKHAALANVCLAILNLDEALTRE
jgi:cytochrome c553